MKKNNKKGAKEKKDKKLNKTIYDVLLIKDRKKCKKLNL